MVASSWKLRLDPRSEDQVEDWLRDEGFRDYDVNYGREALEIELFEIDAAFRFRMQFDDEILA